MWIEKRKGSFQLWMDFENSRFSCGRGEYPLYEVVITPPYTEPAEIVEMHWANGVLNVTTREPEPQTLYAAAQIVANQWPEISTVAVGEVVAAFYREQGNLDRLLKQIDTLPPSSPEIPYDLLESLYHAAEEMARCDPEGCWFWGNRILYDQYRHDANRKFHESIIAIRNWKKNIEV